MKSIWGRLFDEKKSYLCSILHIVTNGIYYILMEVERYYSVDNLRIGEEARWFQMKKRYSLMS